jgi:hypothetical protein
MPLRLAASFAVLAVALVGRPAFAQSALSGPAIHIERAAGAIRVDGDLSDDGWKGVAPIQRWYETNPSDNTEPKVRNVGYLSYDDRYLYAAFDLEDPAPRAIRAPYCDRDNVGNGFNDYAGIIVDARNSGRTATFFVVSPHNIQYDSVTDDNSGEDASPDFFWESATRIHEHGWTLEMRIPFTSLRYKNVDPQTWGILLYRNYPRDFRHQFFTAPLPRDGNCFICRSNVLTGLERLPGGGHLVVAPHLSADEDAQPQGDLGSPLRNGTVKPHVGVDLKWTPNADNAVDLTAKPDFSQVESDVAQISTNERFALFFPEKRPFFLEGLDLFQTPVQAVYTRTITAPQWGSRVTGKSGGVRYTVLVAGDDGGGSVVIPGPTGSDLASQDFASTVVVGRVKREIGLSSVGLLLAAREGRGTSSHNVVLGPDFQWRPSARDVVTGQWMWSDTRTPVRRDLADEWNGQSLASYGSQAQWSHNAKHYDAYAQYRDIGRDFRADTGYVPQVGYREGYVNTGWTFRPTGLVTRLRTFTELDYQVDRDGRMLSRSVTPGFGMDTRWNGFMQLRMINDRIRVSDRDIDRRQFGFIANFSPSRHVTWLAVDGRIGRDIDFTNARPGTGGAVNLSATVNLADHLDVGVVQNRQWVNVNDATGGRARLFTARVSRLRATYTFTSRLFVRAIAQYVATDRDPALYLSSTTAKEGDFSGQLLVSYKLNWQSVLFAGYGDDRELDSLADLRRLGRQFFVKLSYALQR